VGAKLIGCMWTDGMTDMAKLIGALSDLADAPKMLVNMFPGKWVFILQCSWLCSCAIYVEYKRL
jgi:hypothetical protein